MSAKKPAVLFGLDRDLMDEEIERRRLWEDMRRIGFDLDRLAERIGKTPELDAASTAVWRLVKSEFPETARPAA